MQLVGSITINGITTPLEFGEAEARDKGKGRGVYLVIPASGSVVLPEGIRIRLNGGFIGKKVAEQVTRTKAPKDRTNVDYKVVDVATLGWFNPTAPAAPAKPRKTRTVEVPVEDDED